LLGTLTLDQLRGLVTILETGSFSAAGRKLQRAQSAISHAVQTLEQMQRMQIFDWSGRAPVLTEAGRALVAQARQVLRQADLLRYVQTFSHPGCAGQRSQRLLRSAAAPRSVAADALRPPERGHS